MESSLATRTQLLITVVLLKRRFLALLLLRTQFIFRNSLIRLAVLWEARCNPLRLQLKLAPLQAQMDRLLKFMKTLLQLRAMVLIRRNLIRRKIRRLNRLVLGK